MNAGKEVVRLGTLKVSIIRSGWDQLHFAFQSPNGVPYIVAGTNVPFGDIEAFASRHVQAALMLSQKVRKRYAALRWDPVYESGEIVYLLGRPYVLYIDSFVPENLLGDARASYLLDEMSVVMLCVRFPESMRTRREAYHAWADGRFKEQAERIISDALTHAGSKRPRVPNVIVDDLTHDWAYLNHSMDTLCVNRKLVGYPPECLGYVFVEAVVEALMPQGFDDEVFEHALEQAQIPRQHVEKMLGDSASVYAAF